MKEDEEWIRQAKDGKSANEKGQKTKDSGAIE